MRKTARIPALLLAIATPAVAAGPPAPRPPGRLVDLGGHRLHILCTGAGRSTVVVENGLGDFSFDWALVQDRVSRFARICTYDRAGYAWSDPGPKPRTFAQINLELRDALHRLGEKGPFILVGHSYGGPVVRQFAQTYRGDVAGLVLAESVSENQPITIPHGVLRLFEGARGAPIPEPRESMLPEDRPPPSGPAPAGADELSPIYARLPEKAQQFRRWAQALTAIDDAEASQREWSVEYFARWHAVPQDGILGDLPLIVLTREKGGYGEGHGVPAERLEKERRDAQAALARLSTRGEQRILPTGHPVHLEAPDDVARAIEDLVDTARSSNRKAGGETLTPTISPRGRRTQRPGSPESRAGSR
jgi:pimeloyl-ACP methyl ester carboxylesterase